jgi:uncharacterized membrane protein
MKQHYFILALVVLIASSCFAQYTFTSVDYPGAAITRLVGLNDHFEIVGHYIMPGGVRHAMLFSKGQFIPLDPDGILGTHTSVANQVNNRGDITGWYADALGQHHGYVMRKGVVNTIDYPGATFTHVNGVTDNETVIGHYKSSDGHVHGFIFKDDNFTSIDFPGAVETYPYYLNGRGDLAGEWTSVAGAVGHGFLLTKDGKWTSFDAPGAPENMTLAIGVNDNGQILGEYYNADWTARTFIVDGRQLDSPDAFTFIDMPWTSGAPETMNNSGAFVGFYSDSAKVVHGFVAMPHPQQNR